MTRAPAISRQEGWGGGAPVFAARRAPEAASRSFATHDFAGIALCLGGRSRFEHGRRRRFTLEPGDLMLIPSGEPHRWLELERPDWWALGFCVPCFASDDAGRLLEPFERVREGASAVVRVPGARQPFLESLFQELAALSAPGRPPAPPAVQRSLLTLVLHEVEAVTRPLEPASRPVGVVVESLRFIERNCLRPLTLGEVAAAVGKNPAYVTAALSRATGRSAVEWIIAHRMAEARRWLLHSDERVERVAERVGYADPTHFIRLFRRQHGATPAAWRAARAAPAPAR